MGRIHDRTFADRSPPFHLSLPSLHILYFTGLQWKAAMMGFLDRVEFAVPLFGEGESLSAVIKGRVLEDGWEILLK